MISKGDEGVTRVPETPKRSDGARQPWVVVLAIFTTTSIVEAVAISQVFAFLPLYLQQFGLPTSEIPRWVGVLTALIFVFGLPMVPLWGVLADKYSRKAVILRSALVETVVFALIALAREPWQLAAALLLSGFTFGNSGAMLAALRELAPERRLGTAVAIFSATWPVGSAVGPALGSLMVDGFHTSIAEVYGLASVLSAGVAVLLALGLRSVQPETRPTGRILELAYGAVRGVLTEPATRRLFALLGILFLARQMAGPFLPLLVQQLQAGRVEGLAGSIALVVGTASLMGGFVSPLAGAVGDRVGFRPVLALSMMGSGLGLLLMPVAPDVPWLALANAAVAALGAAVSAMIFGILAVEVPVERRSATLNLVYLPLYLAGILGPAVGAVVVAAGLPAVFALSGLVLVATAPFAAAPGSRALP